MTAALAAAPGVVAGPGQLLLEVAQLTEAAPGIRSVVLRRPDGGLLPGHPPGAHLVLDCGPRRAAYSLTGEGLPTEQYRITVLLRPDGSGASAAVHRLRVGDRVVSSRPRSAFAPVATARHHLLVAGGIGITPLLGHAAAAVRWNRSFALLYAHRPGAAAHLDELRALCGRRLTELGSRAQAQAVLADALAAQPIGTHLYVCGPAGLVGWVGTTAAALGWPAGRVHVERFTAADLEPGAPFVARLTRSRRDVAVPAGTSLLAALAAAGVAVPSSCRQGVCGECRLPVTGGRPLHRDLFLGPAERAAATAVMACVSRAAGGVLELDL